MRRSADAVDLQGIESRDEDNTPETDVQWISDQQHNAQSMNSFWEQELSIYAQQITIEKKNLFGLKWSHTQKSHPEW